MSLAGATLLRAESHRRMPWKNGGGETIEVAAYPEGAGLDAFGWRVSMATVAADGPFSAFPGVDRTLSILAGEGLALTVGDAAPVALTQASAPHAFAADVATSATLVGGAVTDLNVMTRREFWAHTVRRVAVERWTDLEIEGDVAFLVCASGRVAVEGQTLGPRDALRLDGASGAARLTAEAPATAFLITLRKTGD